MHQHLNAAQAQQQAISALAAAGLTGFDVRSQMNGAYVTTRVSVSVGHADQALADRIIKVLDGLPYRAGNGAQWDGNVYQVWVRRRAED